MRIDRPTLIAALVTLAAAAPVYTGIRSLPVPALLAFAAERTESEARVELARELDAGTRESDDAVGEPEEVAPRAQVSGTLRTPDGTPVAGELVELVSLALGAGYAGTSDRRGRFAIPDVMPGSDYELHVVSDGRYRPYTEPELGVPPEGLSLELVLHPLARARLAGRMVDVHGVPIPHRALLLQASHLPGQSLHITGDDRGLFWIEDAPTGQLTFSTRRIPHIKVRGPLLAPASEADILVVLDEGSHELSGFVVGDRDVPVAGAQLKLSWSYKQADSISSSARTAVTEADGSFRFTELGPGPHQLVVRADGYEEASETYRVSWNSPDVELRLRPLY